MEDKNGMDYAQNYDVIVKLMGNAFIGLTLDVIGEKSGRIEEGKAMGIQVGKALGVQIGALETACKMLLDAISEKFGVVPPVISENIRRIRNTDTLDSLFRQVFRCDDMQKFEEILGRLE